MKIITLTLQKRNYFLKCNFKSNVQRLNTEYKVTDLIIPFKEVDVLKAICEVTRKNHKTMYYII